jgi:hypothetical protein
MITILKLIAYPVIELIVLPDEGNNIGATLILIVMYLVTVCKMLRDFLLFFTGCEFSIGTFDFCATSLLQGGVHT